MTRLPLSPTRIPTALSRLLLLCVCAIAMGCATHERATRDVAQAVSAWQRERVELPAATPAASERRVAIDPAPDTDETSSERLQTYVRAALERNPSVRAAVAHVEAKLARIPQATSLPDPMLRAIIRPEPIQTAVGDVYFTLGVGQKIPLLARLERAGRIAAAEVRMAIEQLNATRLRVISDVERAYFTLYLMDRSTELTAAHRASLEDMERVVNSQYEAGRVLQQDVLRLQTDLANLRDDESRFRLRRASAAAALNQIMDRSVTDPLPTTGALDISAATLDVEELIRAAESHSPELARLSRQTERDRERVELTKLGYWPDVTLGVEWSYLRSRAAFLPPPNPQTGIRPPSNRASEGGDDNWAITLQLNVPIWSQRIEGAKREARRELLRTQHELSATRNLLAFRIFDAWTRVQSQQETVHLLRSALIPQAQQTYEVTLIGYQSGATDFLTLIDSWRRRLDFELMLHREIVDLQIAFSQLQRDVGAQLIQKSLAPADPPTEG